MTIEKVYLVKGKTSGNLEGQEAGLTEWQFSDGPAGDRNSSQDYTDLEQGLREHSGCVIIWDESNDD